MKNAIILYLNPTRMKLPIPFFLIVLSLTGCVSVDNKAELAIEKEVSEFINNSNAYALKKPNVGNNSNKTELLLTRAISLNP